MTEEARDFRGKGRAFKGAFGGENYRRFAALFGFQERFYRQAVGDLRLGEGGRALDLGCGPGGLSYALAETSPASASIVGADISDDQLECARRGAGAFACKVEFLKASMDELPFPDGHFDLGPAIENGTLVARIKDDRSQPAQWVDPTSLTFALGDAARITAPADLSFVASAGSSVWLIPSTQIAGVPWLGLNSQREEIVSGTTGGVQFTLDAVEGPGRVAVFNAGALGSGVGEHVFDGPGSAYTLGANTHAHQNWVFTAPGTYTLTISMRVTPNGEALAGSGFGSGGELTATGALGPNGRPMVSQVVGRTASGKDCDLSLATTGADTIPLTVVSLTWALTGPACVWVGALGRRRNLRAQS